MTENQFQFQPPPTGPVDAGMLEELGLSPKMQALMQLMAGTAAMDSGAGAAARDDAPIEMVRRDALDRIAEEVEELREVNAVLAAHCEYLARAVGACPECWGEDQGCETCGGDGGPGAFMPDRRRFGTVVLPALNAVRAVQRDRKARRTPVPQPSSEGVKACSTTT